MSYRAITI